MKCSAKKCALLLCAAVCVMCLNACTLSTEVDAAAAAAVAKGFEESYLPLKQENPLMMGEGKAFWAELTGDDCPEAVVLYDDFHTAGVMAFDHQGQELARFETSSFYNDANITFSIYNGANGRILATRAICPSGAADDRIAVTEYFICFSEGKAEVKELFYIANEKTGVNEYFVSSQSSEKITRDEYLQKVNEILQNGELLETIELKKEDAPIDLLKKGSLEKHLLECINPIN